MFINRKPTKTWIESKLLELLWTLISNPVDCSFFNNTKPIKIWSSHCSWIFMFEASFSNVSSHIHNPSRHNSFNLVMFSTGPIGGRVEPTLLRRRISGLHDSKISFKCFCTKYQILSVKIYHLPKIGLLSTTFGEIFDCKCTKYLKIVWFPPWLEKFFNCECTKYLKLVFFPPWLEKFFKS